MSETNETAAGRVRAFVDRWTAPDWLGRNDLQRIDEHELTIADLRAVLDEREHLAARVAELEARWDTAARTAVVYMQNRAESGAASAELHALFADRIAALGQQEDMADGTAR